MLYNGNFVVNHSYLNAECRSRVAKFKQVFLNDPGKLKIENMHLADKYRKLE